MAVDIDSLQIKIQASSAQASRNLKDLESSLSSIKSVARGGVGLTAVAKQLTKLQTALSGIKVDSGKISSLVSALQSLSTVQKSTGLNSTINALKKLPDITNSLKATNLNEFANQISRVVTAVAPLATEMQKVSRGFAAFPVRIQRLISSSTGLAASNTRTAKSFTLLGSSSLGFLSKLSLVSVAVKGIASVVGGWITESNAYIENLNLFTVAMGEYAAEAQEYAEQVGALMGIDPSEWMRNQGVFMSMANGFGLAREQAYALSEGLTEISYDLSSLYNEDVEQSALRLQSALSGEIEPIRRLGISISQATLQEYALAHGIEESVTAMTEQEKALLRSLVLMEGAARVGAIGDFAKTLESPANAMRILRQQITQLGRALGTVLLPIIVQIIPWVQAFVSVLTDAIKALATLVGFTMPEWETKDWSDGLTTGATEAEDAIGGVSGAAKELKKELLGIDELTILEPPSSSGAGGVGGIGSSWASDLEIPDIWDKEAIKKIQTQADDLKDDLKDILYDYVLPIGAALAAWKIASGLISTIAKINPSFSKT